MGKSCDFNRRSPMLLPCDFCSSKLAVLYCKADSAKLCLICDQQVHSANSLSAKHIRSRVCDSCKAQPVSVRLSPDRLLLCQDCDLSVSSLQERSTVEGFCGCPSAIELARIFGFDNLLNVSCGSSIFDQEPENCHDFTVPEWNSSVSSFIWSFERENKEVFEQLVEMRKRDAVRMCRDGAELGPGTPQTDCGGKQGNLESVEVENGDEEELMHQKMPFVSLLMLGNNEDWSERDCVGEGELVWNSNPAYEAAQIWDFELGRSRDYEEPSPPETTTVANNTRLLIENYTSLSKETSMTRKAKVPRSMIETNYSLVSGVNLSNNNQFDQSSPNNGMIIEENKNAPVMGSMLESKNVLVMEQPLPDTGENIRGAKPVTELELLAQNRGNAMLRYMEKKKTRRFDKRIRYESRKARADTRKRVKGRFVKASDSPDVEV